MPAKILFCLLLIICTRLSAQTDSLHHIDSVKGNSVLPSQPTAVTKRDTIREAVKKASLSWQQDTAFNRFFINKKVSRNKQSVYAINVVRQPYHDDGLFYILVGLLLFTGIIRALFPKYFTTLFQAFFQSAHRQRQSKESLVQDELPSFLLNLVFILSGGLLLSSFIGDNNFSQSLSLPVVWLYACAVLAIVYLIKSFFITLFGWSFSVQEAAGNYRFIVFLVNKVAGLCFIPLLWILLYSTGAGFNITSTIAVIFIVLLFLYRYIVSLSTIGKKLKIHPLHFFLYLCAVEILPLLVTYKVLLITKEL